MGETRDTERGSWTVFEGDAPKAQREYNLSPGESINSDIEWPITLRVHRIKDRVMESVDIEVSEDFVVTTSKEALSLEQ